MIKAEFGNKLPDMEKNEKSMRRGVQIMKRHVLLSIVQILKEGDESSVFSSLNRTN